MTLHSIRFTIASLALLLLCRVPAPTAEFDLAKTRKILDSVIPGTRENVAITKILEMGGYLGKDSGEVTHMYLSLKPSPRDCFTDDDIKSIDFAAFPHLRSLSIDSSYANPISDPSVAHLAKIGGQLTDLEISGANISDSGLEKLFEQQRSIQTINLSFWKTPLTDKTLRALAVLEGLHHITLPDAKITDAGIREITDLPVSSLKLPGSSITDAGLKELRKMKMLGGLDLSRSKVTDAGLQYLAEMDSLIGIRLDGTAVTDVGILKLADLPRLRELNVKNTKVTENGKKALQDFCPKLNINKVYGSNLQSR